jgi:hypothetical protein
MKLCASWAFNRFVSATLFVGRRGIVVEPVLDVQAGVRTFENHLGHSASVWRYAAIVH